MAIKFDCPRCRNSLLVPGEKAGSYVNCPRCGGRFWVPKARRRTFPGRRRSRGGRDGGLAVGAAGASVADDAAVAASVRSADPGVRRPPGRRFRRAAPPVVPAPPGGIFRGGRSRRRRRRCRLRGARGAPARLVRPPPRVARLISADAAQSLLKPSADGATAASENVAGGGV